MTLPASPSTTYVPNNVPVIKAQDLNDFQKYLVGLYNGTYTVASIYASASVGNMITPVTPGTIVSSRTAVVSSFPATGSQIVNTGTLARGTVVSASAVVNGNGTMVSGINPQSVGRTPGGNATGDYTIIWTFSNLAHEPVVHATVNELRPGPTSIQAIWDFDVGTGRVSVRVYTWYISVQTDLKFSVCLYGDGG